MTVTKILADDVKYVAGPFDSKDIADDWRFSRENYSPDYATVIGYDDKIYVANVSENRRNVDAGSADPGY